MLLQKLDMCDIYISSHFAGYARISNVEFFQSGQEGFNDPYDPRFSLTFLNTGAVSDIRPSYVTNSAFHHGFSPAIGVFGTNGITISGNVIHNTVGTGTLINCVFVFACRYDRS